MSINDPQPEMPPNDFFRGEQPSRKWDNINFFLPWLIRLIFVGIGLYLVIGQPPHEELWHAVPSDPSDHAAALRTTSGDKIDLVYHGFPGYQYSRRSGGRGPFVPATYIHIENVNAVFVMPGYLDVLLSDKKLKQAKNIVVEYYDKGTTYMLAGGGRFYDGMTKEYTDHLPTYYNVAGFSMDGVTYADPRFSFLNSRNTVIFTFIAGLLFLIWLISRMNRDRDRKEAMMLWSRHGQKRARNRDKHSSSNDEMSKKNP